MSSTNGHTTRALQVDDLKGGLEPIDTAHVYSQAMSQTLRERVKRFQKAANDLSEEVALMRALVYDAVAAYSVSDEKTRDADVGKRGLAMATAGSYVAAAVDNLCRVVSTAHKVSMGATINPQVLQAIIFQSVNVFDTWVQALAPILEQHGIDPGRFMDETAQLMDQRVGMGLENPGAILGTSLTPEALDQEVADMLGTVPAAS